MPNEHPDAQSDQQERWELVPVDESGDMGWTIYAGDPRRVESRMIACVHPEEREQAQQWVADHNARLASASAGQEQKRWKMPHLVVGESEPAVLRLTSAAAAPEGEKWAWSNGIFCSDPESDEEHMDATPERFAEMYNAQAAALREAQERAEGAARRERIALNLAQEEADKRDAAEAKVAELERHAETMARNAAYAMDRAERLEAALRRICDLGWQENYIGPWVQEEAWRIADAALHPAAEQPEAGGE